MEHKNINSTMPYPHFVIQKDKIVILLDKVENKSNPRPFRTTGLPNIKISYHVNCNYSVKFLLPR